MPADEEVGFRVGAGQHDNVSDYIKSPEKARSS